MEVIRLDCYLVAIWCKQDLKDVNWIMRWCVRLSCVTIHALLKIVNLSFNWVQSIDDFLMTWALRRACRRVCGSLVKCICPLLGQCNDWIAFTIRIPISSMLRHVRSVRYRSSSFCVCLFLWLPFFCFLSGLCFFVVCLFVLSVVSVPVFSFWLVVFSVFRIWPIALSSHAHWGEIERERVSSRQ